MSSSRLLSSGGGGDSLDGVLHDVSKLKSLDEIPVREEIENGRGDKVRKSRSTRRKDQWKERDERVPDHASVLDSNLIVLVVDLVHLLDSVVERLLSPEDGGIGLKRKQERKGRVDVSSQLRCCRSKAPQSTLSLVGTKKGQQAKGKDSPAWSSASPIEPQRW